MKKRSQKNSGRKTRTNNNPVSDKQSPRFKSVPMEKLAAVMEKTRNELKELDGLPESELIDNVRAVKMQTLESVERQVEIIPIRPEVGDVKLEEPIVNGAKAEVVNEQAAAEAVNEQAAAEELPWYRRLFQKSEKDSDESKKGWFSDGEAPTIGAINMDELGPMTRAIVESANSKPLTEVGKIMQSSVS